MIHFVELAFASFFTWCYVLGFFGRWLPVGGIRGYVRTLVVLAIVLGMRMTPPLALEIVAAVGAVSTLYALADR